MKTKIVLIGTASILGAGVLFNKAKYLLEHKREVEIYEIQSKWHKSGFEAGYQCGIEEAERRALIKPRREV